MEDFWNVCAVAPCRMPPLRVVFVFLIVDSCKKNSFLPKGHELKEKMILKLNGQQSCQIMFNHGLRQIGSHFNGQTVSSVAVLILCRQIGRILG